MFIKSERSDSYLNICVLMIIIESLYIPSVLLQINNFLFCINVSKPNYDPQFRFKHLSFDVNN